MTLQIGPNKHNPLSEHLFVADAGASGTAASAAAGHVVATSAPKAGDSLSVSVDTTVVTAHATAVVAAGAQLADRQSSGASQPTTIAAPVDPSRTAVAEATPQKLGPAEPGSTEVRQDTLRHVASSPPSGSSPAATSAAVTAGIPSGGDGKLTATGGTAEQRAAGRQSDEADMHADSDSGAAELSGGPKPALSAAPAKASEAVIKSGAAVRETPHSSPAQVAAQHTAEPTATLIHPPVASTPKSSVSEEEPLSANLNAATAQIAAAAAAPAWALPAEPIQALPPSAAAAPAYVRALSNSASVETATAERDSAAVAADGERERAGSPVIPAALAAGAAGVTVRHKRGGRTRSGANEPTRSGAANKAKSGSAAGDLAISDNARAAKSGKATTTSSGTADATNLGTAKAAKTGTEAAAADPTAARAALAGTTRGAETARIAAQVASDASPAPAAEDVSLIAEAEGAVLREGARPGSAGVPETTRQPPKAARAPSPNRAEV